MADLLLRLFGYRGAVLHTPPSSYPRYRWIKKHLEDGPVRTLDAGCGSGTFTMLAASKGNDALGVTDSEVDCAKARGRAALLNSSAQFATLDLREIDKHSLESFDQIILIECIEHIINDRKLVTDLAALLKPGGRLILTTPYLYHRPYFEEWRMQTPGVECSAGHVRFGYTHEQIKELFDEAGLETICESYMVGFISIQITNLYLIGCKLHPYVAWAATFPLRVLQMVDRPLTKLLRYPYLSIGVIGRKRL